MKLTVFLLTAAFLNVSAKGVSQKVTFSGEKVPLSQVFESVEKQTGFVFFFTNTLIKDSRPVTISAIDLSLNDFLRQVFNDQPLSFLIENNAVIVSRKPELLADDLKHGLFSAPPITVRGRIVNEKGEPVVASIVVKGTNKGTTSNANGNFELFNVNESAILIISATNIKLEEILLSAIKNGIITVLTSANPLDEIVFKGYYKENRRVSTGSTVKIGAEQIEKQPVSNPIQALIGNTPGVEITQASGLPGSLMQIKIRGQNSLRTYANSGTDGNLPFYVIDGVPFPSSSILGNQSTTALGNNKGSDPLNSINPADIQSIEILKDADATAIYGSRGANGVVLITTKRGRSSPSIFQFNLQGGIKEIANRMDLLNTTQYLEMRKEAFQNDNMSPGAINTDYDLLQWDQADYTDWQETLIGKTGQFKSLQSSLTGGNEHTQFRVAVGHMMESTVLNGDFNFSKTSASMSINHLSHNKRFSSAFSVNYNIERNLLPQSDVSMTSIFLAPNAPEIYQETGALNWAEGTWPNGMNPLAELLNKHKIINNTLFSTANLSYQVIPNLVLKSSFGYSNLRGSETRLNPASAFDPSWGITESGATFGYAQTMNWIIEPQLDWVKKIGLGTISFLVGSTIQQNNDNFHSVQALGIKDEKNIEDISAARILFPAEYRSSVYKYIAGFGRINFNYNNNLVLNATFRRDASSKFGTNRQFGNFGAIGTSWIFSNQSFFKNRLKLLSFGKLRASYGIIGNDQIPDYGYAQTYSISPNNSSYIGRLSLIPSRLANPDFSWESNRKFEVGIELGVWNDRIISQVNFYRNRSSNQLVGLPLPAITGFSSIQYNLPALVQNSGIEFLVSTNNISTSTFSWRTSLNLTIPKNKLIDYPELKNSPYANLYEEGKSLYVRKLYHYSGFNMTTGLMEFEDVNKDGKFSSQDDKQFLKEVSQKAYGGLINNISFRRFSLNFTIQFVKQTGVFSEGLPGFFFGYSNVYSKVMNRWQHPGQITDIQPFTQNFGSEAASALFLSTESDKTIVDASFLRLRTISLTHDFTHKKGILSNKLKDFKVFVNAQNLFTCTKYQGLDPETQSLLPPMRVVTIGLQFSL